MLLFLYITKNPYNTEQKMEEVRIHMKKAAILLAAIFLLCTGSALAAAGGLSCSVAYDVNGNKILIEVTESTEAADADKENDDKLYFTSFNAVVKKSDDIVPAIVYSDTTDASGKFSKWFVVPESVKSGIYTLTVKTYAGVSEATFWYLNKTAAQDAVDELNGGTPIESVIDTYSSVLGVDLNEFKNDANIAKCFKQYMGNNKITVESFYNMYNDSRVKAVIISDAQLNEKLSILKSSEKIININYSEIEKQSSELQNACFEAIKTGYNSADTLAEEIENNLMMCVINGAKSASWEKYADLILNVYKDTLKLDTSDYKDLKYKSEAIKEVKNGTYNEMNDLKEAFETAVDNQKNAEKSSNKNNGGGIGGGGGSNGGGAVVNVQFEGNVQNNTLTDNEQSGGFTDIGEAYWAGEAINYLAGKGIVNGRTLNRFEPESNITRAEFSKIIAEAFFSGEKGGAVAFNDVEEGEWYYNAVSVLAEKGIVKGSPDGYFSPNSNISREDMAVIIARTAEVTGKSFSYGNSEPEFFDGGNISDYAVEAVTNLYKAGVISGMPDGTFAPRDNLTRAQACKVIWQVIK